MMESEGAKVKQTRKGNFSESELRTLVSQFAQNKTLLQAKHSSTVTNQKKAKVWGSITAALNATGTVPRTVDNVKKKWLEINATELHLAAPGSDPRLGEGHHPRSRGMSSTYSTSWGRNPPYWLGLKVGTFLILSGESINCRFFVFTVLLLLF